MPRRKQTPIDEYLTVLTKAPWWVGPTFAVFLYVGLRWLVPAMLTSHGQPDDQLTKTTTSIFAKFSAQFAPMAFVLGLFLWVLAEGKKLIDRRRLDRQTGLDSIADLGWREFEELAAEAFRRKGYEVDLTGGSGGDDGIDIVLHRDGEKTLVQCKQWRSWKVGVTVVRELLGAMTSEQAEYGIVVAQGRFTVEAESFAEENGIELIGGDDLIEMIRSVQRAPRITAPRASGLKQEAATSPRSQAPSCPRCGAHMVRRTARQGVNAGKPFWGCSKYPACRGIRSCG